MLRVALTALLLAGALGGQVQPTPVEAWHAAARTGDIAGVTHLLAAGVDVNARDPIGGRRS